MNNLLLIGSTAGAVVGVAMAIAGLYLGDRWAAIIGLVAALMFGAAIVFYGMSA